MDGAGGFVARSADRCRQDSRVLCASPLGAKRRGEQDTCGVRRRRESRGLHAIRNGRDVNRRKTLWRARICRDGTDSGAAEKWLDIAGDSNGKARVGEPAYRAKRVASLNDEQRPLLETGELRTKAFGIVVLFDVHDFFCGRNGLDGDV